jgi:hypothetical protein
MSRRAIDPKPINDIVKQRAAVAKLDFLPKLNTDRSGVDIRLGRLGTALDFQIVADCVETGSRTFKAGWCQPLSGIRLWQIKTSIRDTQRVSHQFSFKVYT